MNVVASALIDSLPYKLFFDGEEAYCRWMPVKNRKFTEPFFDETINKCRQTEYEKQVRCVSSIDVLPDWAPSLESIQPSAIIFHVSRCGSTLISQLLASDPTNIVLSEVPFFDELLRWKRINDSEEDTIALLNAAIKLYGARRHNEERLFIKTDSWHIFFYSTYRKLFPDTPFILLYRRPDEVIRSQQKKRGMQSVPGLIEPRLLGFDEAEIMEMHPDIYMSKVLEKYFDVFIKILQKDALAFPLNYNEGALNMMQKIAEICSFPFTGEQTNKIKQRAGFHAKYPGEVFSEESVNDDPPGYCMQAFDLYEKAEEIRRHSSSLIHE